MAQTNAGVATVATSNATSSINEKPKQAADDMSFLLHAVYGIDHYLGSNYLLKWEDHNLDRLQGLLQQQLEIVNATRRARIELESLRQSYVPLHRVVSEADAVKLLNPQLVAALSSSNPLGKISRLVEEDAPHVYSFELLSDAGCQIVVREVENFARSARWALAASNRRNVPLHQCGLDILQDVLMEKIVKPLSALLFPDIAGPHPGSHREQEHAGRGSSSSPQSAGSAAASSSTSNLRPGGVGQVTEPNIASKSSLDYRYGYVIGYTDKQRAAAIVAAGDAGISLAAREPHAANGTPLTSEGANDGSSTGNGSSSDNMVGGNGGSIDAKTSSILTRHALIPHTDDSEVTLNICLGKEGFEGGDLIIRGLRNTDGENAESARIRPVPGRAVIHLGQHLHEVAPVLSGERYALIMWARSVKYRRVTCPCCLVHRRTTCICDTTWN